MAARTTSSEFYDQEQDRVLVFLTNHLTLAAATVAAVYKQRGRLRLFFKALQQSLRVKTFVGTSANALKTQIWAALIAMLLIKYLQLKATFGWSLSNLVALLRQQLFVYRDFVALDRLSVPSARVAGSRGRTACARSAIATETRTAA